MDNEDKPRKKGFATPKGRTQRAKRPGKGFDEMGLRVVLESQKDSQHRIGQIEEDIKKLRDIVQASLIKSVKRGDAIEEIKQSLNWLKEEREQKRNPNPGLIRENTMNSPPLPVMPPPVTGEITLKSGKGNGRPPYMKFIEGKGRSGYRDSSRKPILEALPKDYLSVVLVLRWIEFLLERVVRDKISLVLDYYKDIGWISENVKSTVMSYARGENQDVMGMDLNLSEFAEAADIQLPSQATEYRRVDDWRLTAEDHLKSLLFVQMIAGIPVDKDRLSSLEQVITKIKRSLDGFHSV